MSFKDICGHEKPVTVLQRAIEKERVSHAYLFFGMGGVGKKTAAETFAKALNCTGSRLDACGKCLSCRKISRGNHPDVMVIKPEGQFIRIQEVRELQNQMRFKPLEGRKRVFIVIDAEKMNIAAANALLKTLEEPSPSNVLILVSARPQQLPATILSRCQQLRFSPLSREDVASYLTAKGGLDAGTAAVLAASSAGSIGKALEMHRDSFLKVREEILQRVCDWREKDLMGIFAVVDAFGRERETIMEGLDILRTWYRDILVYRETGEEDRLVHRDRLETVQAFAGQLSASDILANIQAVHQAIRSIEQNANKQLTLETLLFKLAQPGS
jgi:DNA polymerase-3 subunit delta'